MPSLNRTEAADRARLLDVHEYTIELDLTRGAETFWSSTTVRFGCREPGASTFVEVRPAALRRVVLNGRELDPDTLSDNRLPLTELAADNELLVEADMRYSRTGEGMHRFVDPADGEVYLYAQSCADDGQRIFACFDQSDLKATFTVSVTAPEEWTVIGNTPATRVAPGRWECERTKPLSTYLITLVAGPYHSVYSEHDGIPLGLHCRRSLGPYLDADTDEMFTITGQCFDRFHELFGIRYPFGKYDQAFVPEFNAGAMENPGCVTFRDEFVFRSAVTETERETRAMVIAHEMSHMWFGDLVTMRWWDDLWLNESFAEYMGHRATAEATRFTSTWTSFSVGRKVAGYAADQRPSTHPIVGDVPDVAHGVLSLDSITYPKGASVLRQLTAWLGDDVFLAGIRDHFERNAYGNASLADLLDALQRASGRDLSTWAEVWLNQPQVNTVRPLVEVDAEGRYTSVVIEQSAPAEFPVLRPHRLGVGLYDVADGKAVLRDRLEVDLDPDSDGGRTPVPALTGVSAPDLLLLNDGDLDYVKVRLDPASLERLTEVLPRVADPLARALLWNAAWDMTRDAELPAREYVTLVAAGLRTEDEVALVETLLNHGRVAVYRYVDPDYRPTALAELIDACRDLLAAAEPGSGGQLAAARGFARLASGDADLETLRGWLDGVRVPDGLAIDVELRWSVLRRLVTLGRAGTAEIDAELRADSTAMGEKSAAECRAALPDPAAKERAWESLACDPDASNYVIEAVALGFWQPEQQELTAPFVARFFTDMAESARLRSPWMILLAGLYGYPMSAIEPETVQLAEELLARDDIDPALRRAVVDQNDEVRRALVVRARDGA